MNQTATIITHGDLDGMTSAIMLLQAIRHQAAIKISNGKHLPRDLEQTAKANPFPDDVYISDIPLYPEYHDRFVLALQEVHERGGKVHLYDHHFGWRNIEQDQRVQAMFTSFFVNERTSTAAKVVFDHKLHRDASSARWLQLLSEKDESKDPGIQRDFALLVALMQKDHFPYTVDVLYRLAFGTPLLPEHERLVQWYFDVLIPREIEAAKTAEIIMTQGGRRIAWIDLRKIPEHLSVSRHAFSIHKIDLTAVVLKGRVIVGTQSIDQGIDMSFLHGLHQMGEVELKVAGHKSPISIGTTNRCADSDFIHAVQEFTSSRL